MEIEPNFQYIAANLISYFSMQVAENKELTAICDELIGKVGVS